jgi:SAM-dependent methyltransferase
VAFDVPADAYGRFMGRYSEPLAVLMADAVGVTAGQRALDVGCGPGALTAELARRLGPEQVSAVDPSESFVAAARDRLPGVEVRQASAEALPHGDGTFDLTLAQLVVHFMADPVGGLGEMARVTRPGGVVAASVWDLAGERAPLSTFWRAVRDLDSAAVDESGLAGARAGHLGELFRAAGLPGVQESELTVAVPCPTFDDWWQPYTLGVGPAGDHVARLDDAARERLRSRCAELLPEPPFDVTATAWLAVATAPAR